MSSKKVSSWYQENIKSALRKKSGGGRSAAFKKKSQSTSRSDSTHDESVGEYIDSSEINPRVPSPLHFQRSQSDIHSDVFMRNDGSFGKGHTDEDSTDYQYAYSSNLEMQIPPERRKGPVPQRSVSLKDDYSQPPDRLSKSSGRTSSESQDYIEPYQSQGLGQGHGTIITVPDTGGIYALAKDITPPPTQKTHPVKFEDTSNRQYSHIVSNTTNALQNTCIDEEDSENYDHLNTWQRPSPGYSDSRNSNQAMKKISANLRQGSSTPEDFFPVRDRFPEMPQCKYEDLPSEYQEPWDTGKGQKKFSRLMQKAEMSDERRKSTDKTPVAQGRPAQHSEGVKSPKDNVKQGTQEVPSGSDKNANLYECAWGPSQTVGIPGRAPSIETEMPDIPPHRNRMPIVSNYEEAWDTEARQKMFEEKLEKVRQQRMSEGKISEKDVPDVETHTELNKADENVFGSVFSRVTDEPTASIPTPVSRQRERENVSRSDSCKSLAALAEKIDRTIPLEDQCFFHGSIKRSDAERMLCVFKDGSYLIRRSESNRSDFSLTLKGWNGVPMHMKITSNPNGTYVVGEHSPPFNTIPEMVEYYTRHELPVQNAERICLLYPIPS